MSKNAPTAMGEANAIVTAASPKRDWQAIANQIASTETDGPLRAALAQVIRDCVSASEMTLDTALRAMIPDEGSRGIWNADLAAVRHQLGYDDAPAAERLLIEQVVLSYLRLHLAEQEYDRAASDYLSIQQADQMERRLAGRQRRHLRAIETLARVRKLMGRPTVQVNIAAGPGSVQNVVAGDATAGD